MPFGIGPLELIIVLVIVLVIFGPKRLPGLGRSLGTGMREFKDSISGKDQEGKKDEAPTESDRIERTADAPACSSRLTGGCPSSQLRAQGVRKKLRYETQPRLPNRPAAPDSMPATCARARSERPRRR